METTCSVRQTRARLVRGQRRDHRNAEPFADGCRTAPALVVQVSDGAVHELIWRPLQGHQVGVLVQREVTRHGLHVVPLKQPPEHACSPSLSAWPRLSCKMRRGSRQLPAVRAHCSCQTAGSPCCFDAGTPRTRGPTRRGRGARLCCCWSVASGSAGRTDSN